MKLTAMIVQGTDKFMGRQMAEFNISIGNYPKCGICMKIIKSYKDFNIDHIVPKSKGGGNNAENLQLAHKFCNSLKGSSIPTPRSTKKEAK